MKTRTKAKFNIHQIVHAVLQSNKNSFFDFCLDLKTQMVRGDTNQGEEIDYN